MTAKGSSDVDGFNRDLTRQLVGVDQHTFQRVKQAIQLALDAQNDCTDPARVIQVTQSATWTAHARQHWDNLTLCSGSVQLAACQCFV